MKKDRCGKAAIFTHDEIVKIRRVFTVPHHRCIFELALFTGERMGAIVQLRVTDVYLDASKGILQDVITFPAQTRKARPGGARETRQVSIHPDLRSYLTSYRPHSNGGYLFPAFSGKANKVSTNNHIHYNAVYLYWQQKFLELGLDHRGFSCHSTRRWFITQLVQNGIDIKTIQSITGHKNIAVLLGYVEENLGLKQRAISTLTV